LNFRNSAKADYRLIEEEGLVYTEFRTLSCLGLQLGETRLGGGKFPLQGIGLRLELGVLRLRCCQCVFCLVAEHDASCADPLKVE